MREPESRTAMGNGNQLKVMLVKWQWPWQLTHDVNRAVFPLYNEYTHTFASQLSAT